MALHFTLHYRLFRPEADGVPEASRQQWYYERWRHSPREWASSVAEFRQMTACKWIRCLQSLARAGSPWGRHTLSWTWREQRVSMACWDTIITWFINKSNLWNITLLAQWLAEGHNWHNDLRLVETNCLISKNSMSSRLTPVFPIWNKQPNLRTYESNIPWLTTESRTKVTNIRPHGFKGIPQQKEIDIKQILCISFQKMLTMSYHQCQYSRIILSTSLGICSTTQCSTMSFWLQSESVYV